ncbi:polysaccharide biosynthesis/export family protein [Cyclobacterium marinum]|uniref:Soluble ligand binding domain-containing protein n=1 Tax=Cyclobacterium marinum (strain ATCC 25205 / DSM 745 / LMG 13164 / NCIMB 1802) TaxID=880070 RepID=G0J245_CYCMS|nr:polysaccharide biosynthesis/export family protein [Cyclobacterium marinum]AEL24554.1 Soluble ligand binding domain-containing protein [Cyclobacterium marinum DSM 745]MBI0399214.1 polysaccharide biosynthesis/export family protein [Cyclobacterium marinum]|tara:strand:- start:68155 stop:68955 length:801 start_codon:yes stop_codon:yes gene_type:complete
MRYNSLIRILTFIIFFSGIFGCAKRNLVYFSDIETGSSYSTNISQVEEPVIQSGDLIKIVVSTQSPESNLLFNSGVISNDSQNRMMNQQLPTNEGYLVDKNGQINFPVLGKIEIAGFTREEATIKMTELLEEYVKDPIINIQYLNFKITVIGEVANPNTFTLATDRISILEALGLAGDMTQYGKRENVLLIRDQDGVRKAVRLNLNDKSILNSPYFMLQQNDVLYVEPDKIKSVQASTNQRSLTILSILVSFGVSLMFNLRYILSE